MIFTILFSIAIILGCIGAIILAVDGYHKTNRHAWIVNWLSLITILIFIAMWVIKIA